MDMHAVVIGNGVAGRTASLTACKYGRNVDVTVIESELMDFYHPCSLPYILSGIVKKEDVLRAESNPTNLKIVRGEATELDRENKKVIVKTRDGSIEKYMYDKLILATGSYPFIPKIEGVNLRGVYTFKSYRDLLGVLSEVDNANSIVVAGASATGIEVASSLRRKGVNVKLVELMSQVMPGRLDEDTAEIIAEKLRKEGIELFFGKPLSRIEGSERVEKVFVGDNALNADLLIFTTGVRPNVKLALSSGLKIGELGGILVDNELKTSDEDIYACGDCVEVFDKVTGRRVLAQFANTAYRQGFIAGYNAVKGRLKYNGTVLPYIVHAGDFLFGAAGLTYENAVKNGFKAGYKKILIPSKPRYMPSSANITVKIVFDRTTGRILGCQAVGGEEIVSIINVASALLHSRADLEVIYNLESAYNPYVSYYLEPLSLLAFNASKHG